MPKKNLKQYWNWNLLPEVGYLREDPGAPRGQLQDPQAICKKVQILDPQTSRAFFIKRTAWIRRIHENLELDNSQKYIASLSQDFDNKSCSAPPCLKCSSRIWRKKILPPETTLFIIIWYIFYLNVGVHTTQSRLMSWYDSHRWVKVKVVKWCQKTWNEHNLM